MAEFKFNLLGDTSNTIDEAWKSFKEETEINFHWIKGHKYWKTKPTLFRERIQNKEFYTIKARVIASDKELGLEKAILLHQEVV